MIARNGLHGRRPLRAMAGGAVPRLAFHALDNRSTWHVDAPGYSCRQAGVTLIHPS
jgi:hypothetical protein